MYATVDELAVWMGRDPASLDATETARATLLLESATGAIDTAVEQPLTQSTDTITVPGTGTTQLVLPRWPVTSVTSVEVTEGGTVTALTEGESGYAWAREGILTRRGGVWPACPGDVVEVVYTAGWAPIPADVRAACLALAAARWPNPAGVQSEQLGDHRIQWAPGQEPPEVARLGYYRAHI